MDSLRNILCDRNSFNNWLFKLNAIVEKLDIKSKRQKIEKVKIIVQYDYMQKCVQARFEE